MLRSTLDAVREATPWRPSTARRLAPEIALVALVTAAIQIGVFHGYYSGSTSPGGDFLGPYTSEAYAWWHAGGVTNPPAWMPYLWGGYPAAASIQNSSWYLPTGLASLFGLSVHVSAIEQALHVALAGLGVYVLGRRAGFGRRASLVGLVAYSLCTGFFFNAPYVDIVHGYALAPWLLLCLSPLWPWRRWWSVPAAAVLLWQTAVGVYPGVLVALMYGGAAWALAWQLAVRPKARAFVVPAAASGLIALLLTMPKYLPLLELKTFQPGDVPDLSVFTRSTLGTFFLPGYPGLPGIYTMNSYFIPVAAVLLVAFARFRDPGVRAAFVALLVAAFLSLPGKPLAGLIDGLPGMGVSRFRANDFRVVILLAITVAGMSGMRSLLDADIGRKAIALRSAAVLTIPAGAVTLLVFGSFRLGDWVPTFIVLVLTVVAVMSLARWSRPGLAAPLVLLLTAASGVAYSQTVTDVWAIDSRQAQVDLWGVSSTKLIAHAAAADSSTRRPARTGVSADADPSELISAVHDTPYYSGWPGIGGYLNVHMSSSFAEASRALTDQETAPQVRALLEAPGILIGTSTGLPSVREVAECATAGNTCGGISTEPIAYSPGHLVYRVSAPATTPTLANEAFYPGWSALLTDQYGRSIEVEPSQGTAGMVALTIPQGDWRVDLLYTTPLSDAGSALGRLGALLAIAVAIGTHLTGRRHLAPAAR